MKKLLTPGIMALTVLASSQALANNFYIGMTAGQTNYNNASGMDKPTAYEIYGGYQFHKHYAFEAGYHDFGDVEASSVGFDSTIDSSTTPVTTLLYPYNLNRSIDGRSLSAALKLIIPASEKLELYAKLGFHYWDIEKTVEGVKTIRQRAGLPINYKSDTDDKDAELMYGIGFDFEVVRNFNLGLRYTAFQVDSDEMSTYGLNANYKFNFK